MLFLVFATFVDLFTTIFNGLIIIRILVGLFASPTNRLFIGLVNITEPLLAPVRKLLPKNGNLDFSPTATVIALYAIDMLVNALLAHVA